MAQPNGPSRMEQALLISRMKMANLSDSATESLGRLSETVSTKAQQTKEDIIEEYEKRRVSTLPDRSNEIFGIPIEQTVKSKGQGWTRSIPIIIEETITYIIEEKGHTEEGIFRLSGRISEINSLKEEYNRGSSVNISKFTADIHSVTGLLKLFLRELPETLFTAAMLPKFDEVLAPDYTGNRTKDMIALMKLIPQICRNTLHEIFDLLRVIVDNERTNKMGINNVSIIFVSTLGISYELFHYVFANQDNLFRSETVTGIYFPKQNNCKESITERESLSKSLPIPPRENKPSLSGSSSLPHSHQNQSHSIQYQHSSYEQPPSDFPPTLPSSEPHSSQVSPQQPPHLNPTSYSAKSHYSSPYSQPPLMGSTQSLTDNSANMSHFEQMKRNLENNLNQSNTSPSGAHMRGFPQPQSSNQPSPGRQLPSIHSPPPTYIPQSPSLVPQQPPRPNSGRPMPQPQTYQQPQSQTYQPQTQTYQQPQSQTYQQPQPQTYQQPQPQTYQQSQSQTYQPLSYPSLEPQNISHPGQTQNRETVTVFGSIHNNPFLQAQNQTQNNQNSNPSPVLKKTTRRGDPHCTHNNQTDGMPF